MREKEVEQKLVRAVKAAGGICPKWVSPGTNGMPDRIMLLPGGRIAFVEVKAPGEEPRKLQLHRHEQLRLLGFQVYVLDHPGQIGGILDGIEKISTPIETTTFSVARNAAGNSRKRKSRLSATGVGRNS